MAEELKPCPFCGETPGADSYAHADGGYKYGAISCSCGVIGPDVRTGYKKWPEWRDAAVAAWNARAVPAGHVVVSEGMLRGMAAFAQEIISGALEGGSFDGADIQESAERHGLIAKHVMNEPCRGPEEYCACAWSTSFPTECYRITAELRALLNQDKENGNG
ncbi:TPA: Lar family restriction alleviation protein [Pseudomonas aeruginosa]|nr:Lar family restriction alleviation protein [Pseudomonas aeruginosa]